LTSAIVAAAAAYVVGCFCAGYYVVRWRTGDDVRRSGSGTAGATNAGRQLGRAGFALTFVLDCLKGLVVVWAAARVSDDAAIAAAVVGVVAGHIWPAQLGFRGGKGIATSIGALAIYDPRILAAVAALFLVGWCVSRAFLISGVLAFILAPLAVVPLGVPWYRIATLAIVAAIVVVAHRDNIRGALGGGRRSTERQPSA
jgi:glycerol-3-phosphate acyltransferase PlsY